MWLPWVPWVVYLYLHVFFCMEDSIFLIVKNHIFIYIRLVSQAIDLRKHSKNFKWPLPNWNINQVLWALSFPVPKLHLPSFPFSPLPSFFSFFYPFLLVAQMVKHLSTMWETWVRSLGQEDPLEKEMATHSSTIAWKIPWMEEPARLQSMGSQRVGHDWVTSLSVYSYIMHIDWTLTMCWTYCSPSFQPQLFNTN